MKPCCKHAEGLARELLTYVGANVESPGVQGTPLRVAKHLIESCRKPKRPKLTIFNEPGSDEMILQAGISFASLCEHHFMPFMGEAVVAYIPRDGKILGLSKLARLVQWHAHGPNNQERITAGVADELFGLKGLKPLAVAVFLSAEHTCMTARGAKVHGATTRTQALRGVFKTDCSSRSEVLKAVERHL